MKAILISIRPKWVAKILNGDKIAEVRKTAPKDWVDFLSGKTNIKPMPRTVFIYCTKGGKGLVWDNDGKSLVNPKLFPYGNDCPEHHRLLNGKVVAKFTLRKVEKLERYTGVYIPETILHTDSIHTRYSMEKKSCLSMDEIWEYTNGNGYAWHISDLVIFDKPKELSEFYDVKRVEYYRKLVLKNIEAGVFKCKLSDYSYLIFDPTASLCKAPQSWQYVEVDE